MNIINITNEEISNFTETIWSSYLEMLKAENEQLDQNGVDIKNKLFADLDRFNASNLEIIITIFEYSIREVYKNKSKSEEEQLLIGYYVKLLTSHIGFLRDFEYYNIALLSKYLLEATTGILNHKDKLNDFFKELTYEEYVKRFENKNYNISKEIEKQLGETGRKLYRDANVFSHPLCGAIYGLGPLTQDTRNIRCLSILYTSYYVSINKILNIFNIHMDLKIFFVVAKNNKELKRQFMKYIDNEKE